MHAVTFRNPFERTSQPLHTVVVIPARYDSTRFPGKALAEIAGRPMVEHVYRRSATASGVDAVIVATDDARIARAVEQFGGLVRMTSPTHRSGLDRVAEVAAEIDSEIVVNVQGDEPLVEPAMITEAIGALADDRDLQMSTLRRRITDSSEYRDPNVVKVVVDGRADALYFSRAPIPFRGPAAPNSGQSVAAEPARPGLAYKHIGLYAYRRLFLLKLASLPRTLLEAAESLEQLRALEHGYRIRAIETQYDSIGVDTPADLERVRRQMAVGTSA